MTRTCLGIATEYSRYAVCLFPSFGMKSVRMKRGVAARRLIALEELRVILSTDLPAERMLRAVAAHLASGGDYCMADVIDRDGTLRRLEIAHADASRRERLRVAADDTRLDPQGRVAALLRSGGAEVVPRITRATSARASDIALLQGDTFGSYMAASISVSGAPMAVLTVVASQAGRQFDADDLAFLRVIAEWTGLGLENALRRGRQQRTSVAPPPGIDPFDPLEPVTRVSRTRKARASTA
jgi:GAF domain-containing protein